jgi:hypothetical protein
LQSPKKRHPKCQKIGIKAELTRRIEAIIEIARLMVKAGHNPNLIQTALIDPIVEAVSIRIVHGVAPKEAKDVDKKIRDP